MDEEQSATQFEAGAAGAPEGAPAADPTTDEIAALYKATGVKAPVPTGKPKGRPKAATVRAKDDAKDAAGDSSAGKQGNDDDKSESKDAPVASKNGDSGNDTDPKSAKKQSDSGEVQDESEEADGGVRKTESESEDDSERRGEEDAKLGDEPAGEEDDESEDATEENLEGKRPGKSNPKIEQRFQRLTNEVKEREQRIAELEQQLQETTAKHQQAQIAQEDPEYTIEDFSKVRDESGEILDLNPEQAELAWRRWKDGYDQRAEQRQAAQQHEAAQAQRQAEMSEKIMRDSVAAYDELASLMDEFPQLVSTSGQFDQEFAAEAMPLINEAIQYQPGTEPGNPDGNTPIIMGMKLNPKNILKAMEKIRNQKRSLPLNGVNDNVEVGSNVNVPNRGRSSDPTVHAANQLYKELNINKRI